MKAFIIAVVILDVLFIIPIGLSTIAYMAKVPMAIPMIFSVLNGIALGKLVGNMIWR